MKNKIYVLFAVLISILMINVTKAESLLTYDETYSISTISDYQGMVSLNNKFYILDYDYNGTVISSSNNDFTEASTKTFTDLSNPTIIKYNNSILLIGIEKNALKVYMLDENLQVTSQKETSYLIDLDATIKAYSYDNKVYLMLFEEDTMLSTTIYEIDNTLNITESSLSSYDSDLMKKVLKGDYYLIRMNDTEDNNRVTHYYATSYTKDYSVLVGDTSNITYDETTGFNYKAHLTIIDSTGTTILDTEIEEYTSYIDVEFVKSKIVILATNDNGDYLLIYDTTGKLEETITLSKSYNNSTMINKKIVKLNNQLIVYSTEIVKVRASYKTLAFYNFNLSIIANENPYGTIEVVDTAFPNAEVTMTITPNEGYEVDTIEAIDALGNTIIVTENKFIMPEEDVYITVNYKASVENPETADIIILVTFLTLIGVTIIVVLYNRLKWLK